MFVAGFIGSPKINLLEGDAARQRDARTLGIRPEHFELSTKSGEWSGIVGVAEHLGSDTFLHVHVDGIGAVAARASGEFSVSQGDRVWLTPQADRIHRFGDRGEALR